MSNNVTGTFSASDIERLVVTVVNSFMSVLGIFGNLTVLILIYKNPPLRKNCKYLQAALAAGDILLCFGQFTNTVTTMIVMNLKVQLRIIRWQCLLLSTHGAVAIIYSMFMTVFIACDRFVAITFPVKYRVMPKLRICLYCVGAASSAGLIYAIATYTDVNLLDYITSCPSGRSSNMNTTFNNTIASAGVCVVIIYPVTLVTIVVKTKRHLNSSSTNQNSSTSQAFLKQVEITKSITCVVVTSLIVYVIPNLIVLILRSLDQPTLTAIASRATSYVSIGSTLHSGVNVLFYIWKDKQMRDAFKKLIQDSFN